MITQHLDPLLFFQVLRATAHDDLSRAHMLQHNTASKIITDELKITVDGLGAYSVHKVKDNLIFDQGHLTGIKHWVSGLNNATWMVIGAKENSESVMVLVHLDNTTQIQPTLTTGMEATFTGSVMFNHTPAIKLYDKVNYSRFYPIDQFINLGFITNHFGLAEALFNDIDVFTKQANINCEFDKKKIHVDLSVLAMIWNNLLQSLSAGAEPNEQYWHQANTVYAFAKKTLVNVCQLVLEVTGSGLYESSMPGHQRYNDALIYSSHMKNLYKAVNENLL